MFEDFWTETSSPLSRPVIFVVSSPVAFKGLSADVVGTGNGTPETRSSTPAEKDIQTSVDIGEADLQDRNAPPLQIADEPKSSAKCACLPESRRL